MVGDYFKVMVWDYCLTQVEQMRAVWLEWVTDAYIGREMGAKW